MYIRKPLSVFRAAARMDLPDLGVVEHDSAKFHSDLHVAAGRCKWNAGKPVLRK